MVVLSAPSTTTARCVLISAWRGAETLAERARGSAVRRTPIGSRSPDPTAGMRLERWRSQPPFSSGPHFHSRLAEIGLTEDDLRSMLEGGEPQSGLDPPGWVVAIERAFDSRTDTKGEDEGPRDIEPVAGSAAFLAVVEPLLRDGRRRLRARIKDLLHRGGRLPGPMATVEKALCATLQSLVLPMINRTCVLELNLARLEGTLRGETSEARFADFIRRLSDPQTGLDLLSRYPVLGRTLAAQVDRWLDANLEWIERLSTDWDDIVQELSFGDDPGDLVSMNTTAGDRHHLGRCTVILGFRSGFRLVYKPRSLALDTHFQGLLAWLNEHGQEPKLRCITVLNRGSYGWTEFIAHQPCGSQLEIVKFYERQGSYLAILHALRYRLPPR
jgi:Domain of unknown function (DUF4135)